MANKRADKADIALRVDVIRLMKAAGDEQGRIQLGPAFWGLEEGRGHDQDPQPGWLLGDEQDADEPEGVPAPT